MREIKFRVLFQDEWHYFTLGDLVCGATTTTEFCDFEFDRESWSEYTGLKDKNGKEIYESDLIACPGYPFHNEGLHNYIAEIVWYDDAAMFGYEYHRVSDRVIGNVVGGSLDELESIEVIGNIYENPELIDENRT